MGTDTLTPGTRIVATVTLGLASSAHGTVGARFLDRVESGAAGVIVEPPEGIPAGWLAATFDGHEVVTDLDSPWAGDPLVAPVHPSHVTRGGAS